MIADGLRPPGQDHHRNVEGGLSGVGGKKKLNGVDRFSQLSEVLNIKRGYLYGNGMTSQKVLEGYPGVSSSAAFRRCEYPA